MATPYMVEMQKSQWNGQPRMLISTLCFETYAYMLGTKINTNNLFQKN